MAVLAFDVYGTLFDVGSLGVDPDFLAEWRRVQLEMSWRATLMGVWLDFDEITRLALKYVCGRRGLVFDESLLAGWGELRPFADTRHLWELSGRHLLYALTNGTKRSVERLLGGAGLLGFFRGIYTAEAVKKYKPAREVYLGFLGSVGVGGGGAFLVSSNPFDVAGAKNAGMGAIYVDRAGLPADPLAPPPDHTVKSIGEIARLPV